MTTHTIKTTQNEIDNGYRELSRLLQGGQGALAVKHAFYLAKMDATSLWNFIKAYVSLELNHRHTSELLAVNALWSNWVQDPSDTFIAHAVLTLSSATKNRSESVLKYMPQQVCAGGICSGAVLASKTSLPSGGLHSRSGFQHNSLPADIGTWKSHKASVKTHKPDKCP